MRWKRCVAIWAVIASAISPSSPAHADAKQDAESRKIMHQYAKCVVRKQHRQAAETIAANDTNADIRSRHPTLIDQDCMGNITNGGLSFGGDLFRYALADALVNADYATQGPSDFTDRLPLAQFDLPDPVRLEGALAKAKTTQAKERLQADFAESTAEIWLSRYGECIVRRDPPDARLWLLTPPDTPEETSRITVLRPAFSACLNGGTLKFNRMTMRGIVAINYYRLAVATPVSELRTTK